MIQWGRRIIYGDRFVDPAFAEFHLFRWDDDIVWAYDAIGDNIIWDNQSGDHIVWGGDDVVWGNEDTLAFGNDGNIVWGNRSTTTSSGATTRATTSSGASTTTSPGATTTTSPGATPSDDNIVWGNSHLRDVWASNVVWGFWDDTVVWDNITRATDDGMGIYRLGQH